MTVMRVEGIVVKQPPDLLFAVERPVAGDAVDSYVLDVAGWVVSSQSCVTAVDLVEGGFPVQRVAVSIQRPDVPAATAPGFATAVSLLGLPESFSIQLEAVGSDGLRTPLASIEGVRRRVELPCSPRLRPLMISGVGRSGTTMLMRMLDSHPGVVVQRTYPYEARPASTWMKALGRLAQPIQGESAELGAPSIAEDAAAQRWLRREYVERLCAFFVSCVDDLYVQTAERQEKPAGTFCAEKMRENAIPRLMRELWLDGREVFLVRDFRDVACSMLAFNHKLGGDIVGPRHASTIEEFIERLGRRLRLLVAHWTARGSTSLLVRYEDLVGEPRGSVSRILDYLDLDADAEAIDRAIRAATADPALEAHRTTRDGLSSIGRWRHDLPEDIGKTCTRLLAEPLSTFGYEL